MGYELTIPLKGGTIEIEFDSVEELEEQLAALDVARVEKAISSALRARRPMKKRTGKKSAKKAAKKSGKKATRKRANA